MQAFALLNKLLLSSVSEAFPHLFTVVNSAYKKKKRIAGGINEYHQQEGSYYLTD